MPQLTNLSPKGADNQPVVFKPVEIKQGGQAVLAHREDGSVLRQSTWSLSMRHNNNNGTAKTLITDLMTIPVVRTIAGIPTVVDSIIAKMEFRFPDDTTSAEREQAIALRRSSLVAADVPALVAYYRDLENLF